MAYEAQYERFVVAGPDGQNHTAELTKAGFLAAGDQPELYFFRVDDQEAVVALSGTSLERYQQRRRHLSREEKLDVAGLFLKLQIAAGRPLEPEYLHIGERQLETLVKELGLAV